MKTGGLQRFGVGQVRATQGVFAFVGTTQVLAVLSDWRYAGGPDGWTVVPAVAAVASLVAVLAAGRSLVQLGDGRISWALGLRHHDLSFDEVADIRPDPRWWVASSQLLTTDGRVLRLPLQPQHGPEVWQLVLGARNPAAT